MSNVYHIFSLLKLKGKAHKLLHSSHIYSPPRLDLDSLQKKKKFTSTFFNKQVVLQLASGLLVRNGSEEKHCKRKKKRVSLLQVWRWKHNLEESGKYKFINQSIDRHETLRSQQIHIKYGYCSNLNSQTWDITFSTKMTFSLIKSLEANDNSAISCNQNK